MRPPPLSASAVLASPSREAAHLSPVGDSTGVSAFGESLLKVQILSFFGNKKTVLFGRLFHSLVAGTGFEPAASGL